MMFVMEYKIILLFMLLLVSFAVYGENGLSDEDKNVLLQAHNYYRSLAAESAANMERMVSVLCHNSLIYYWCVSYCGLV